MTQIPPLISIAMPVRNNEKTLALAVQSLIDQTYPHWELWLMEDGSTDQTLDTAQRFADERIRVRSDGRSLGISRRLNQAIAMSNGTYFARMDGDDIAYPQRLERQVAYMAAHPGVDLVGSHVVVFDDSGTVIGKRACPETHAAICARPFAGFPVVHPTFLGKLDWFRRYGYDNAITYSQDQDLLLRSYRQSRFANVPEILLGYRESSVQLRKTVTGRREFARALWREIRRGRIFLGLRGLAAHAAKLTVEALATSTRLGHRVLRHRATPITPGDRDSWERVRQLVSRGHEESWSHIRW